MSGNSVAGRIMSVKIPLTPWESNSRLQACSALPQATAPAVFPGCIAPPIMNVRPKREVCGKYNAPAVLPPEKNTGTHGIGCVGPRAGTEVFGEVKNILPLPRFKPWAVLFAA